MTPQQRLEAIADLLVRAIQMGRGNDSNKNENKKQTFLNAERIPNENKPKDSLRKIKKEHL